MEVHHHAHTSRNKWTHYFWEFLMLFLAVFCGFLAENFREHKVEDLRAKEFARSLILDLNNDTAAINYQIAGVFDVTLIASNQVGSDTLFIADAVFVDSIPVLTYHVEVYDEEHS